MREHYEFGDRWGIPTPYYTPAYHSRDPWPYRYDPWSIYERRSESMPHWTDDDDEYGMDFLGQPRTVWRPNKKSKKKQKSKKSKKSKRQGQQVPSDQKQQDERKESR